MSAKEKIIEFLKAGVPTGAIADAVGCDPSYVSQIKSDPEVAAEIAAARIGSVEDAVKHDDLLDSTELKALQRIERSLPSANFSQALAAYKILNAANRKNVAPTTGMEGGTHIHVSLTLPQTALPKYVKNAQNEIIEVEGRTMVTATTAGIDALLAARATKHQESLPLVTDMQKAARVLENLPVGRPKQEKRVNKLPSILSVDIL